jgi:enterochelin esterase-like enzyme/outer membrane protein assembly factor BamB
MILVQLILASSPGAAADEWLGWGGPNGDYTVDAEGLADAWPEDGPPRLWQRPLGPGYPSILFKDDRLYTMYRDAETEEEVVVALAAGTGETIWEHRYGVEIWDDMSRAFGLGPNATPLIVDDRLISVSIDGEVRCLDLATGKLQWRHDLPAEYGRRSRDEEYGYSASPFTYQGRVIVMVGGDDHAVVAYDPETGSTAWKSEPGGISYAPPTLTTIGGKDQYIYFSPQGAVGLDPATGKTLWSHEMEYSNGNHLTPIVKCDDRHIWIGSQFRTGGGRLLEISGADDTWTARQVWFETNLRASHWTSILLGDYIYGSIGGNRISLLTAFEWRTGKVIWSHRGFHKALCLFADNKLLFLDEDGMLTLAWVSPEKLEVLASTQVTESVSWSLPTLVGTTLYLRDNKTILALDLADKGAKPAPRLVTAAPIEDAALMGAFGEMIRGLDKVDVRQQQVDAYLAKQESFPIVEGEGLVHFVYRGDAPAVGVTGNFLELNQIELMHHVAGTDLHFRSYQLAPASHYEYGFDVFEDIRQDPLNPRRLIDADNVPSVVTTRGWQEPAHLAEPEASRGTVEKLPWRSKILENERELSVWLPPGYQSSDQRYPLVIVNYGKQALREGRWGRSLDNLCGKTVAPLIVVFVPRVDFTEYAPRVVQLADAIEAELIPMIVERYRTLPGTENRLLTGIASGGFASVYIALSKPQLIGNVAVQSFYFRDEAEAELRRLIARGDAGTTRFYVEWSSYELKAAELDCQADSRELAELLEQKGYALVTNRVTSGAGWGSWRAQTGRILEGFFPAE